MEINPYDNFDNWSCILLNTLQCSQDYIDLIADCIDLIFSILSENQLPEPITSYTDKFLNYVIPEATISLLKIYEIKDNEIDTCISYLTTSLTLCTWGVQNNKEPLFKLPPLILDKNQYFYYKKKEHWKTVMDYFLSSGDMNLFCDIMTKTDPFPPLFIYLFVSKIILVFFKDDLYDDIAPFVEKFITVFGNYLMSIMDLKNIRNIDKNTLDEILSNFYKILSDVSFDHMYDLSPYYEFFEFCLKSDILFIQLFITKSFHYFLIYAKDEIILQFSEWCKMKDFIKFLISKDFNEEIIKQLVPIFDILADKDLLNRNTLYILWNRTLHVHSSLRSSYISLIARILHNMKSKDANNYLSKIMINGNKDISELDMVFEFEEEEESNNLPVSHESSSFNDSQEINYPKINETNNNNNENKDSFDYNSIPFLNDTAKNDGNGMDVDNISNIRQAISNRDRIALMNMHASNKHELDNNEHDSKIESNSNSTETPNEHDSNSVSNSNSTEIPNEHDSNIETKSNSTEISNEHDSNSVSNSNSTEIPNEHDSNSVSNSNSTETPNEYDSNIETKSNSTEIPNEHDSNSISNSNSTEISNEHDSNSIKNSNSTEISNEHDSNSVSNSNSTEIPNEHDSNIETNSNNTEIPNEHDSNIETNSNSTEIPNEHDSNSISNSNSTETPNAHDSNIETNSNNTEIPNEHDSNSVSNSNSTEISNEHDSNSVSNSNSTETPNAHDSNIETNSNSTEIPNEHDSNSVSNSNSTEIPNEHDSNSVSNSNSTEISNEHDSNSVSNSNSIEIPNEHDSNSVSISNSTETPNAHDSNIETNSNSTEISKGDENSNIDNKASPTVSNDINSKSTSEESYYNYRNYRYDYMSISKYNEICSRLSHVNYDFQLTNDLLQLLLGCLYSSKPDVSYYIISILFEFSKKDDKIAKEFQKSVNKKLHYKTKMFLFYKCFDQIQNTEEDHHIVTLILPKLINTVGYNVDLGRDFEQRLFDSLPYDRPLIYSIISIYYQGNAKYLPLKRIISIYNGYDNLDDEFWSFMKSLLDTNGTYATNDSGFETLKECIDHADFRKATTKFVYFLKSYYLILNLYENRLKTEDYYKTIIKGKITFYKSNEPPIGLDQFFRLLELAEDDHVALSTINIILLFTTSYESFNCEDVIGIIKDVIIPKIQSKESIKRYLNVLYDISFSSELNINLIDYNYPKHSIYDKDIIILDISGLGVHQTMICDKHDTFNNINDRLINLYPFLEKQRIYFNLNGSLVCDENNFLETYKIDKNNRQVDISLYDMEEFEKKNLDTNKKFIPNCPSLFLTEQHFQSLLLSFYNDQELCQTVNQFLNFLPNDPDTIKLIESKEILISLLLDGSNSYVSQYYLQVLISILKTTKNDEIIYQFKNIDFCNFLCQFLEDHEDCSYEIISILQCLISIDLHSIIDDIIKIVCNILSAKQMNLINHSLQGTQYIASQLFYTILSKFRNINILAENPTLLESVVSNATFETWPFIRNGIYSLIDVMPLFDSLLNHIEQGNNSRYFAELFTAFVPRVSNECNVSKILDMCIDLLTSQDVFEDKQSLISLCEMTSSILNSDKQIELNKNLENVISKTLPVALKTDDKNIQSAIYDLCIALASRVPDGQHEINQIMKSVYQIQTDRWNYKPDNFTKSSTGFVGLTNLGATCYMNSVLQQLFFFRTFRDSVFTETFESIKEGREAFFEFQKIFARLLLSKKSFAETRPFCNLYLGWGKKPINVREQQDAVEFVNMFLDQLPESLQRSYRGTIINQIEGISEEFKSNNVENFFSFSLEIKNFSTIEESFDNFLQDELFTGENQIYADSLERKIDARKYSRIKTAPPVLILQLKRFEYDIHTFVRNKIYSRFVIPQTINIKKLLENEEEMLYELKGVVVHFGNANGGHYTSIIKIDGNFYNFNDMNVSNFDENDFEKETFGGNQMSNCAYLLFYERKDDTKNEKEIDIESEKLLIDSKIRDEIEIENDEFIRCQIAFTLPTMRFASYCNDVQQMTDYFINIFLHSELGDESHIIVERLRNCIISNSKQKWYIDHLNQIFKPKIEEFLLNCSNDEIINSFINIVKDIIDDSKIKLNEDSILKQDKFDENEVTNELIYNVDAELLLSLYNLANSIMQYVSFVNQWRQYKNIFTIPYLLLKNCNLNVLLKDVSRTNDLDEKSTKIIIRDQENQTEITNQIDISSWRKSITDIIVNFYKETNSEVVLENVDFSKALKICQRICPVGEESPIMEYYNKIILSKANIISFFVFALKTKQTKFDIESGFTYFYNENFSLSDCKYFVQYAKNVLTLTDFNCKFYLFDQEHFSATNDILNMYVKQINDRNNFKLRTNLINNYENYVLPFLISEFSYTRDISSRFTLDMFPEIITIDEVSRSYRGYDHTEEIHPPTEKQIEELTLIWNQLHEQIQIISNDPKQFIINYGPDKVFKQDDFRCLQFLYILKWLKIFVQSNGKEDFDLFMNMFNSFKSLEIPNNTNLHAIADIITSFPTEYWIDDSYYIVKELLTSINVSLNSRQFQTILDIIQKLSDEKIDEIFNNDQCFETLVGFFRIQNCIAKYDTFPFVTKYLTRNPSKIDHFCVIFDHDNFNVDTYHENMECILNIPGAIIPFDYSFSIFSNIIQFISNPESPSYECRRGLEILSSLQRHIETYEDRFSTDFDFGIIDFSAMNRLIEMMNSYNYSSNSTNDIIELLCIDNNVRLIFYSVIHQVLSQQYLYNSAFNSYLDFYIKILKKYGTKNNDGQELPNEIKFIADQMIKSIEKSSLNNFLIRKIFDLIIENYNKEVMKDLLLSILKKINIIHEYDSDFEPFVTKLMQLMGFDDMKLIIIDFCNYVNVEKDYNVDISEICTCNLAIVIGIFPDILQLIKDQYQSLIPEYNRYLNLRVTRAFYPNKE